MHNSRNHSPVGGLLVGGIALLASSIAATGPGFAESWGGAPIPSPYAVYDAALTTRYAALSDMESLDGDSTDEWHFWYKAKDAKGGYLVLPEDPSRRNLAAADAVFARTAYRRLLRAYRSGMPGTRTEELADAQASYDCWLNDTEEGANPARADACRADMEAAMAIIDPKIWPAGPIYPKPVAAPAPADSPEAPAVASLPLRHLLFFRNNSAELSRESLAVLDAAARDAAAFPLADIRVDGFTDRTGDDDYNRNLSQRRTAAVSRALRARGINTLRVDEVAIGETALAVPTSNNVAEPRNRRVEIEIGMRY